MDPLGSTTWILSFVCKLCSDISKTLLSAPVVLRLVILWISILAIRFQARGIDPNSDPLAVTYSLHHKNLLAAFVGAGEVYTF